LKESGGVVQEDGAGDSTVPGQDAQIESGEQTQAPKSKGAGVEMEIPAGTGTTLYKRLKGEMIEGEELSEEVIIESDLFPNEMVNKKLSENWFRTKDEAANAPPDKPEGD